MKLKMTEINGKISKVLGQKKINILKLYIIPNYLYIQCNVNENFNDIFHRNRFKNTKIHVRIYKTTNKRPLIVKFLRKKNKTGDIILPDLKLCYKEILIKIVWYWYKSETWTVRTKLKSQ